MAFELGSVGLLVLLLALGLSPFALILFRPHRMPGSILTNLPRMARDHWPHVALFLGIYLLKNYVDTLNDPIRGVFGDFTFLIHNLEGDLVLHIQNLFHASWLTALLNANYLFGYIFLTYFGFILFAYMGDRDLANKMVLNVVVVYLLSIPFYVFFNVQITADYVPGMRALLYHDSPAYLTFFTANDPLDNAFPSLHIGIPFGFFVLLWWAMRDRGETPLTWRYRRYLWVVAVELVLFAFSILYLGIHWILDIPGGLAIGLLGAVIVEELHRPWIDGIERIGRKLGRGLRAALTLGRRARAPSREDEAPGRGSER